MPRAAFLRRSKPLLLLLLAGPGIGVVWWFTQPHSPPEPIRDGLRLSTCVLVPLRADGTAEDYATRLARIRAFGPDAVPWLIYTAEHGRREFKKKDSLPLDHAPHWLRRGLPVEWGGLSRPPDLDEPFAAISALEALGPDAAPALPTLVKILKGDDRSLIWSTAAALNAMGPASWPTVQDALDRAASSDNTDPFMREALLDSFRERLEPTNRKVDEAEAAPAVATLIRALEDPNSEVRIGAAAGIELCKERRRGDDRYDAAIPILVHLLSDPNENVANSASHSLSAFGDKAATVVPQLIALLDSDSPVTRYRAALTLPMLDYVGRQSAPRLRLMLQDSDEKCRLAASGAFERFIAYSGGKKAPWDDPE